MQVSDPSSGLQEERTGAWSSFSITVSAEVQTEGIRWVRDYGTKNHSSDSLYSPLDNDVSVGPTQAVWLWRFFPFDVLRLSDRRVISANPKRTPIASTRDMCFSPVSNPERVNPLETKVLWFHEECYRNTDNCFSFSFLSSRWFSRDFFSLRLCFLVSQ